MHVQLEELWMDAIEMKVGEQIVKYLRKEHPEYQDVEKRQRKLIKEYPMLQKAVDGDGAVTLNEKEHYALKEYLSNQVWKRNTTIIMDSLMYSLTGAC